MEICCRRSEEFCGLRSLLIFPFRCAMYNHVSVVQFLVDHVSIMKNHLFNPKFYLKIDCEQSLSYPNFYT